MVNRFESKVAIVTGGGGAIGRATAIRLASEGAKILLVDLDGPHLADAAKRVEEAGGEAYAVAADVSKAAEVEHYVSEAERVFGGVDFLFNNAGIEGFVGSSVEYPEEAFDRVLAVNVKGVWLGMKAVYPRMVVRGGGVIVNTSSVAGLRGSPSIIAYSASKHAVIGMTRSAAIQFAPDRIRVNAVCPGPIDTRMMRALERGTDPDNPGVVKTRYEGRVPMGRYGQPEEVAALVAFLLSDDASYISGAAYPIDGGMTA